jgi:tetratricopeptide (TPR) repeat protein
VTHPRAAHGPLAAVLAAQVALAGASLAWPGWTLVNLDKEHNLPTYFHSALLAAVGLCALDVAWREALLLRRLERSRWWALSWLGMAGLFGYLAIDESLVIHEGFLTAELSARLAPTSPLQLTLAWLLVFLPGMMVAVAFLAASLGTRARISARLVGWGGAGLLLWLAALTLEGTTKSFFIPRGLYWLEVLLEETAESLGTTAFGWSIWSYRRELTGWLDSRSLPPLAVPWRWVVGATSTLAVPAAVIAFSVGANVHVLQRYVGDGLVRAGRLDEAEQAYRVALTLSPRYAAAWDGLGLVEYRRGNWEAAGRAFAEAETRDPSRATFADHRGAVLFRQGRYAEAAEAFARAVALDPRTRGAHENLGLALRRLGREAEAEAAFRKAWALGPAPLRVTAVHASLPAGFGVLYVAAPGLETALEHTRAGRLLAAASAYRAALATAPGMPEAHLGLANELVRLDAAERVRRAGTPVAVPGARLAVPSPSVLFEDWVRLGDGAWELVEVIAPAPGPIEDATGLRTEARRHYERAIGGGLAAPAQVGLAILARGEGRHGEARHHLEAARSGDAALPPIRPDLLLRPSLSRP